MNMLAIMQMILRKISCPLSRRIRLYILYSEVSLLLLPAERITGTYH